MSRSVFLAAVAALVAGCVSVPDYASDPPCAANGACPTAMVCNAERRCISRELVSPPADAGGGPDLALPSDGPVALDAGSDQTGPDGLGLDALDAGVFPDVDASPDLAPLPPRDAAPPDSPPDVAPAPDMAPPRPDALPVDAPVFDWQKDLVALWRFDEMPGSTTAADSSGNGNVATLKGSANPMIDWVAGHKGGAFNFNGNGGWMSMKWAPILDTVRGQYTFATWVLVTGPQTSCRDYTPMIHRQVGTGSSDRFFFGFHSGGEELVSDMSAGRPVSFYPFPGATWTHVAAVYDGRTLDLYVNGEPVASEPEFGELPPEVRGFTIGAQRDGSDQNAAVCFLRARLDEMMIYRRVLSPEEIKAIVLGAGP